MKEKLSRIAALWAAPAAVGVVAAVVGSALLPESNAQKAPAIHFSTVNVTLPTGSGTFPPGPGVEIANANCVICHSTGMVLRQPPLTENEWKTEIMKMRNAFGAPIAVDQIDALARYLSTVNGRKAGSGPSGVTKEAS
jgi:mono/diheme cytochrome c family protein